MTRKKKCKMEILRVTANCERHVEVEPLRSSVCLSVLVFPFVWFDLPSYILRERRRGSSFGGAFSFELQKDLCQPVRGAGAV